MDLGDVPAAGGPRERGRVLHGLAVLKGDDLRINQVDLVEIDLRAPQIYGTTWATLFSPRIQNYTIGIEPTGPSASQSSGAAWPSAATTETRMTAFRR